MINTVIQKFGNSGHVILPKEYLGKKVKIIIEPKSFHEIKSEVMDILNPYLENIIGVYLYGSYSRNDHTLRSDIDILVVTNDKINAMGKINDYTIISATLREIEYILEYNAILILPILKEAKTIINPEFLQRYQKYKFTKKNTKIFIEESRKILELNEKGLELNFDIGSIVYSLILRIRSLLMIKFVLNDMLYSKGLLFKYLKDNNFSDNKIKELYKIYTDERTGIEVKKSNIINKNDIKNLLNIANNLLNEIKSILR